MRKLILAIAALSLSSYALAANGSIGTASTRGEMRVDGYSVAGSATLFEGTVIETYRDTTLHVDKGVQLVLTANSRGVLYHDRFVLKVGQAEVTAAGPFRLEANGLEIVSTLPNTHGVVATNGPFEVGVKASSGGFHVAGAGSALRDINAGESMVFDYSGTGGAGKAAAGGGVAGFWAAHSGWIIVSIFVGGILIVEAEIHTYLPSASR
jgi:hypothetical protein